MLKLMQKTALVGAMILTAGAALAEYPERPIEVIVGYSAGGGPVHRKVSGRGCKYRRQEHAGC